MPASTAARCHASRGQQAALLVTPSCVRAGSFPAGAATAAANWGALPLVFGIMAFVYSGHGVFPSIQRSMKEPSRFPQARLLPSDAAHDHGPHGIILQNPAQGRDCCL